MEMKQKCNIRGRRGLALGGLLTLSALAVADVQPAGAASSDACEGGGYQVLGQSAGEEEFEGTVPAPTDLIHVQGTYNQFDIRPTDFAVLNYAFTGAPNEEDITGGRFTPVYESKIPDHRGLVLNTAITLELDEEDMVIERSGTGGLDMKIQAKDCAQGGIFQMEVERGDNTRTRVVHRLAGTDENDPATAFYFDNPNFRERIGQFLGDDCVSVETGPPSQFCVQVSARVNIANGLSEDFLVRDSAQVATRIPQPECGPDLPGTSDHCGGMSVWDVASGGRMGMVTGEDAGEVANPPTTCVQNCQAQNQVRGRLATLGHPFPVPADSRLTPRYS